jgi:hypothetical protein
MVKHIGLFIIHIFVILAIPERNQEERKELTKTEKKQETGDFSSIKIYKMQCNDDFCCFCFTLIDEILKSMNNEHLVGGIFCDLQKAFDCVSHDIFIKK